MLVSGLNFPSWFDQLSVLAPNTCIQPLLGSPTCLWLDILLPSSLPSTSVVWPLASCHLPSPQLLCLSSFFPACCNPSGPYSTPHPLQGKQCLTGSFLIPYLSPVDHVYPATPASLLLLEYNHTRGPDFKSLAPWLKLEWQGLHGRYGG